MKTLPHAHNDHTKLAREDLRALRNADSLYFDYRLDDYYAEDPVTV